MDEDLEDEVIPDRKYWECEECKFVDIYKLMPGDRQKFYARVSKGIIPKCPECGSYSFMPKGY